MDFFETASFANIDWYEIWLASVDTFWMLGGSLLFTVVLGLPLGVLLFPYRATADVRAEGGLHPALASGETSSVRCRSSSC